ncbi:MAG TPA: M4 family metallopeptidase, partial [Phycisphaerae bacterium]|nr:M4 family metallopeptidase [Phycisphaerae bacterium]
MKSVGVSFCMAAAITLALAGPASAQQAGRNPAFAPLLDKVHVVDANPDGTVRMITGRGGQAIPVTAASNRAQATPQDFLAQYGPLFGADDAAHQLALQRVDVDDLGEIHTTYMQVHAGVPVFSGELKVHTDASGQVVAANGDFHVISAKVPVVPLVAEADVIADVIADMNPAAVMVEHSELVIVDPGWYGDAARGARLAYYLIVSDNSVPTRQAMFIDARTGETLDEWSLFLTARNRAVYNGNGSSSLPGTLARSEGQGPVASPADVNRAYDYAGDIYDYYFRGHNRDSIDGSGMTLILTVNSTNPPCPNAGWNGTEMVFCSGTVTDDITAHEMTHGVTEHSANLIYQNQSGQLNESYSDVFGELIDLYNGDVSNPGPPAAPHWPTHPTGSGVDTPNNLRSQCSTPSSYVDGVRWLMGEDATAFGGAIRDMWNPECFGDPDRNNSPQQTCSSLDNGGVHSGSGVGNHAFAIITDGKTFNGQTVTGIGPIKAAAVWYRALTVYLTPASDYRDAYFALNQAAADLVGTTPNDPVTGLPSSSMFTAADAAEVDKALLAVEMDTDGSCGSNQDVLDPFPPPLCSAQTSIYFDDFESGANGWTTAFVGSPDTPYNWVQTASTPPGGNGSAWFCADLNDGCPTGGDETAVHRLTSPVINLPAGASGAMVKFRHYVATEAGYDGGNVKVSVNGGNFNLVPSSAFDYNDYNVTLDTGSSTNPLGGEPGWSGAGGGWGTSVIDLAGIATAGDSVQFRFEFGKDYCNGVTGWYVDDFDVFICSCSGDGDCDDGNYCNGAETCLNNICTPGADPCPGEYCSEANDACATAAFVETFDNGNVQGWTLRGSGSTASTGDWLFGNPNGTSDNGNQAQPEDPYEGSGCAFTAQNSSLGTDDVDSGVIYLVSPAIDLSGEASAELAYTRWFFNRDVGNDSGDFFVAEVSSNNGSSWVNLETLNYLTSANTWTDRTFALENFIPLTSTVRLRFGAADGSASGNIIEAALDSLRIITVAQCTTPADCDDGNVCNGAEDCVGGSCIAGTPLICDDGIACTQDTCDSVNGCAFTPNDALCADDGTFCNGTEYCDGGSGCTSTGDPCGGATWCEEGSASCVAYGDGDMDHDGDHDLRDFALFQGCFGAPVAGPACEPANLSGDAMVDGADLQLFVNSVT